MGFVYDESKSRHYLNYTSTAKGWGKQKLAGLITKIKRKPELIANHFDGL